MDIKSKDELGDLMKQIIDSPEIVNSARILLGESSLMPSKVGNWKKRGTPDGVLEGAALLLEALKVLAPNNTPPRLFQEHKHALERTNLWCEDVYHTFYVEDGGDAEKVNSTGWRYWHKVRKYDPMEKAIFTHVASSEGDKPSFKPIGNANLQLIHESQGDLNMSISQAELDNGDALSFGHEVYAPNGIRTRQKGGEIKKEFLGGMNVIPTVKSHLIISIPEQYVRGVIIPWLSFSPQVNPLSFILATADIEDLTLLFEPDSSSREEGEMSQLLRSFLPWGKAGPMIPGEFPGEFPEELAQTMNNRYDNPFSKQKGRRLLHHTFEYPLPLNYQLAIYPLP